MLYLVPTPIGNLGDISFRAVEILNTVDVILAEDTRQTAKLMAHYNIQTRLQAFHAHNEHRAMPEIIQQLKAGATYALVTDAGSPGISDPGFLISRACQNESIQISALPGATAFVPALTASGLPSEHFYFEGFLPQKKGRQTRWKNLQGMETTIILYESPFRLLKCLNEIKTYLGDERLVCVAREISKIYEEVKTLNVTDMIDYYTSKPSIKGEIVIVIGRKSSPTNRT